MHADEHRDHARYGLLAVSRCGARPRPGTTDENGFTLVELLVATAVGLVVLGALVTVMTSVLQAQPEQQKRAAQIQDGRVTLERMVRELRQGKPVTETTSSSTQISVDTYTRSGCGATGPTPSATLCRVSYSCTGAASQATCTRRAGSGAAETVLTGLASSSVFSYGATTSPSCELTSVVTPSLVCLTLAFPAGDGLETVTIEDSAYLRNPAI